MAAAGVSDGAIIIDTGIDNSGITKDARITQKLVNGLKNLIDRIGKTMGQSWQGYTRAMRESLRTSQAVNAELAQLQRRWAELNREIMAMERAGVNSGNAERYRALKEELYQVVARMRELRQAQQETSGSTESEAGSTHNLSAALLRVAGAARTAAGGLWGLVRRGISSGFHAIANAAKRAGKALAGLTKHQKQHNNSLGIGFKNILKYGLGIRSLYVLFNRLRAAVKEGFGELRKSAPDVDKALKNLKTSLTGLKGSLATAFAPILTAIEPALTTLIDLLTRAINAIGAFMAALSGASFYYVANSVSNVANGVEDVGNAASNASGDVKALKRQLAGFDELNILSQSSGGGGGGSGSGSGLTYTKTPIESGITDFVARLRSMWQDADFEGIGKIIADKINGVFTWAKNHVSWNIVGDKVTSVVRGITGAFNGLVDGIDGTLIGSTVAEVLNTITYTVDEFVSTINFGNAGKKLGEAITAMIYGVDWSGIGKTIANLFNGSLAFIRKAINEIDFGSAGTNLATALKNFILKIDWNGLGGTIVNMTNGALAFVSKAIKEFDFGAVGRKLGGAIQTLIVGIDWNGIGETVGRMFNASIAFIRGAINNIDLKDAGTKLGAALNNLVFTVDWTGLGDTMKNLFNDVIAYIGGAIDTFDFASFGTRLGKALNAFVVGIDWNGIGTTISNLFKGALAFLAHAVREFNWGDAGKAFAEAVNGLVDEIDPETISGLIEGVLKGAIDWGEAFLQDFDAREFAIKVRTALEKVDWKAIASKMIALLKDAVGSFGDILSIIVFGEDFTDEYATLYYPGTLNIKPESYKLVGSKIIPDEVQKDFEEALKTGNWNTFEVAVKTKFPAATADDVAVMYNTFINAWNKLHPEAIIDPALPKDAAEKVLEDWRNKNNTPLPATVDAEIDEEKFQQEWDDFVGHPFNVDTTVSIVNDAPKWAKNIKTWLNTALKGDNIPTFAAQLKNDAATWWDNAKKWWGKAVKSGGQLGTFSVGVKDNRTGWWDKVKKWWGKAVGKETVEFSVKPANNSKSWWDSVKSWWDGVKKTLGFNVSANGGKFAGGGYVTNSGRFGAFASGGAVRGSVASWWNTLPKYASGTRSAHGTMFLAGEAGPEIVGHVGGRTEVLNKSQLAQTMFAAVENGMLAAASRIEFHMPAMASGTVLPYDVSAQIAKTGQDIMTAMDANNEDLIQTIISVAGQIVNALGGLRAAPAVGGMTAQQVINALNQRTQMFGESPLQGV